MSTSAPCAQLQAHVQLIVMCQETALPTASTPIGVPALYQYRESGWHPSIAES